MGYETLVQELKDLSHEFYLDDSDHYTEVKLAEAASAIEALCKAKSEKAPAVSAEWLDVREVADMYVPDFGVSITTTTETCSACKTRIKFCGPKLYIHDKFCPYCGAPMEERT